jgi:tetratricopeptide (TPR) repeat protein
MKIARWVPIVLLTLCVSLARAGDTEAQGLLKQAYGHWGDPQPDQALRLAEQALAQNPTSQVVRTQILLFIGSLHQAKTGNLDAALEKYDQIIQSLVGTTDNQLKQLKAEAMVRKGNILYSEKDDAEGALRLYQSAHQTWQLSTTVNIASQLAYRMGREAGRKPEDRTKFMDFDLKAAQESVELAPRQFAGDANRQAANLAICKLQLAIVQQALGHADEAQATYASIQQDKLNEQSLYQQALYHALKSEADQATDCLHRFMATRPAGAPGLKARNQLRKFIRTEPDFAQLRTRDDWHDLVTDEAS